jgi:twitching motility protein PilT
MRDPETIKAVLTLAETGHLVLSTLHTNDSVQTVDRIVDIFPTTQQKQIRMQLAMSLICVLSQRLIPRADKE